MDKLISLEEKLEEIVNADLLRLEEIRCGSFPISTNLLTKQLCWSRPVEYGIGKSSPEYKTVFGVARGGTCFDIAQQFNLTTEFFDSINPNVNCNALFVGQWLCIAGTA
ncbi:hypothetical protein Q3G72_020165 [Acer saccharum]|nr:hypothetical protein Q3G72_020165 [Acer saccharum]